jgi:uncharacterized protein (TIRG00374 family)
LTERTRPSRAAARRLFGWLLAIAALAFVAWMVPMRDRCWDPGAPASTRVAVTREAGACILHLQTGDVPIDGAACERLQCEPGFLSTFGRANVAIIAALLALYALGTLAWAARWRALLAFAGVDLPLTQVWRISTEAQAGGVLLPGGIGGDALRVTGILTRPTREGETRAPTSIVVASVLLDRAIGLSLIAGVAATLGVLAGGAAAGAPVVLLAGIPVGVFGGLVIVRLQRIRGLAEGRVGRAAAPVIAYLRDPRAARAIAVAALFSVGVAVIQFAVIRGLISALGASPSNEEWIYVGTAMAFIVGAVPALPGGWGTADATYVFFFKFAGVGSGAALAVCLVYRLFWYASGVVGALLFVSRRPASPEAAAPAPADEP